MDGQARILSIFAFIVTDEDGTEGVPAIEAPGLAAFPLMGADLATVAWMRPHAQRVAQESGKALTLAHFSVRTDSERLEPDGSVTKL